MLHVLDLVKITNLVLQYGRTRWRDKKKEGERERWREIRREENGDRRLESI